LAAAQPAVEQLRALLAAITPVVAEAHSVIQVAKETAMLTKATATTLKTEAESCMAAISVTTVEVTKMAQEEADNLRQLMAETRQKATQQLARVDQLVTRTTDRFDETAALVQSEL